MSAIAEFVAAAREAASAAETAAIDIAPAGVPLRVELAGRTLIEQLRPGLLAGDDELEPVAQLHIFDSAESGVAPPPPPWPAGAFQNERTEIAGFSEPPRLATYDHQFATLSFFDEQAAAGVQWFRDGTGMAPWEGGATARHLLRWALAPHGAHMIHGAAVGGALLCGPGGAGKSTSALAGMLAGLPFTADDFVVITTAGAPVAHAAYAHAKATEQTIGLLPELEEFRPGAAVDWRGKLRLPLAGRITAAQPISVIVLPARADRTGPPRELSAADALRRASAGNVQLMPGATTRTLTVLTRLLEKLPAYELPVGPDVESIPSAIAELAGLGAAA